MPSIAINETDDVFDIYSHVIRLLDTLFQWDDKQGDEIQQPLNTDEIQFMEHTLSTINSLGKMIEARILNEMPEFAINNPDSIHSSLAYLESILEQTSSPEMLLKNPAA